MSGVINLLDLQLIGWGFPLALILLGPFGLLVLVIHVTCAMRVIDGGVDHIHV